jgi:hypothetical protein
MGFGSNLFCKAEIFSRPLAVLWTSAGKVASPAPADVAAQSFPRLY